MAIPNQLSNPYGNWDDDRYQRQALYEQMAAQQQAMWPGSIQNHMPQPKPPVSQPEPNKVLLLLE